MHGKPIFAIDGGIEMLKMISVNPKSALVTGALSLALALGGTLQAGAGEKPAPKPKMTVTQITQDSAEVNVENAVMIGMIMVMAVTLINTASGGVHSPS